MDGQQLSRRALLHTPAVAAGAALVAAPAAGALAVQDNTELSALGIGDGGWCPIDSGSHTGGSFTIDLTDGGNFPAGTFSMIRLHFTGAMDTGTSDLLLRVNVDGSSGLHQFGLAVRDFSNWDSPPDVDHGDTTIWRVAQWHNTLATAEVTILDTERLSRLPYLSRGVRYSGAAGSHRQSEGSGRLTANRLINSIQVRVGAPAINFTSLLWWAEGYQTGP